MPSNTSSQDIIEERRMYVAKLRRQGRLSYRQIAKYLEKEGKLNPHTQKAWSYVTIKKDLDTLKEQARAEAMQETVEHKAEILADYHELLNVAWQGKQFVEARNVLREMRALLGTDAPQVAVFEQMVKQMDSALDALEEEFKNEPDILQRAFSALMGAGDTGTSAFGPN